MSPLNHPVARCFDLFWQQKKTGCPFKRLQPLFPSVSIVLIGWTVFISLKYSLFAVCRHRASSSIHLGAMQDLSVMNMNVRCVKTRWICNKPYCCSIRCHYDRLLLRCDLDHIYQVLLTARVYFAANIRHLLETVTRSRAFAERCCSSGLWW